jgi:DNA invertase Pin-like site-specific DNA recombinase
VAALSDTKRGGVLLVAKRDRLGRDALVVLTLERLVERKGARIVSAAGEGTDDDPTSVLLRRILDAVSEHKHAMIRGRTSAALRKKRRRGERTGGSLPLGSKLGDDGKTLEADEDEQAVMDRALTLRDEGKSIRAIAATLNAEGLTTKTGKQWNHTTAHRLLKMLERDLAEARP